MLAPLVYKTHQEEDGCAQTGSKAILGNLGEALTLPNTTGRLLASRESPLARGCLRILEDVCLFDFDDSSPHLPGKLFSCISEVERVVWPRLSSQEALFLWLFVVWDAWLAC